MPQPVTPSPGATDPSSDATPPPELDEDVAPSSDSDDGEWIPGGGGDGDRSRSRSPLHSTPAQRTLP